MEQKIEIPLISVTKTSPENDGVIKSPVTSVYSPEEQILDREHGMMSQMDVLAAKIKWRVLILNLTLSIALIVFVVLPIFIDMPYYSYPWLNSGDVWKMLDPMFILPILFMILVQAPMFSFEYRQTSYTDKYRTGVMLLFLVGAAVYIEGHAIHTCTTIIKDPVKVLLKERYPNIPEAAQVYSYIRDDWEHLYSHYIYVSGFLLITVAYLVAFTDADFELLEGGLEWSIFVSSVTLYGVLFAAVCANFPQGLAVGLVWIFSIFIVYILVTKFHHCRHLPWLQSIKTGIQIRGRHLVWEFYVLSYLVALVSLIIYVCIFGWKSRSEAGIKL